MDMQKLTKGLSSRFALRGPDQGGHRGSGAQEDDHHGGAPSDDGPKRRPHPSIRQGEDCGGGQARGAGQGWRDLRADDQGAELGIGGEAERVVMPRDPAIGIEGKGGDRQAERERARGNAKGTSGKSLRHFIVYTKGVRT